MYLSNSFKNKIEWHDNPKGKYYLGFKICDDSGKDIIHTADHSKSDNYIKYGSTHERYEALIRKG